MIPPKLTIPEDLRSILCQSIPPIIEETGETAEVAMCRMLAVGLSECLRTHIELNNQRIELLRRHVEIEAAVSKMKKGLWVTNDEIDLILQAAKAGFAEAAFLVADVTRFGRSMKRKEGK